MNQLIKQANVFQIILGALITALITVFVNSYRINDVKAIAFFSSYEIPDEFKGGLCNITQDKTEFNYDFSSPSLYYRNKLNNILDKQFESKSNASVEISPLLFFSSYWEFKITNNGKNEVNDLILDIPSQGYYKIVSGNSKKSGSYVDRIKIGSIRPSNSITLYIWSDKIVRNNLDGDLSDYYTEDVKLTHPNGLIKIDYLVKVRGIYAFLSKHSIFIITLFAITVVVLISAIVPFAIEKKVINKKNNK